MASTESLFRRLALDLPGAAESSHMGAADFRLNGRIFATLAYLSRGMATVKLTPEQQAELLADLPGLTEPAPGGWGRMGMTLIRLDAPEEILRRALAAAYHNVAAKQQAPARKRPKTKLDPSPEARRPRLQ